MPLKQRLWEIQHPRLQLVGGNSRIREQRTWYSGPGASVLVGHAVLQWHRGSNSKPRKLPLWCRLGEPLPSTTRFIHVYI